MSLRWMSAWSAEEYPSVSTVVSVSSLEDVPSSETSKKSRSNSTKDETETFFRKKFVTPIGSWPSYSEGLCIFFFKNLILF